MDPNFSGHEQSFTIFQGYEVKHLRNSFKKFYGRYPDHWEASEVGERYGR